MRPVRTPVCSRAVKLCKDIFSDSRLLRKLHGWSAIGWFVATPLIWLMPEQVRMQYVIFLSQYALVLTHWGSWQAARVEVKQDAKEEREDAAG